MESHFEHVKGYSAAEVNANIPER